MLSALSQFIFGASHPFGKNSGGSGTSSWKDKCLNFDLRSSDLALNHGEQLIAAFFPIEDIKGNQDEMGLLKVTNLRLIWICCNRKRVNLSIGWRTVSLAFEQNLKDSFGCPVSSLVVLTKYDSTKYEFVFNRMASPYGDNPYENSLASVVHFRRLMLASSDSGPNPMEDITHLTPMFTLESFEVVFKVWQAYKRTVLFRQCRINLNNLLATGNQHSDNSPEAVAKSSRHKADNANFGPKGQMADLNKLPGEQIIDVYSDILQYESKSSKPDGTLVLTNIRLLFIDNALPLRNFSIPYLRVDSVKLKQSGERIVIVALDYLASSMNLELMVPKQTRLGLNSSSQFGSSSSSAAHEPNGNSTANNKRSTNLIYEQIQNLTNLYKSKPKFGPESCDECIQIMCQLRSIEDYNEPASDLLARGPLGSTAFEYREGVNVPNYLVELGISSMFSIGVGSDLGLPHQPVTNARQEAASKAADESERDLSKYQSKLKNYMQARPFDSCLEVIYSPELGLAIERPTDDVDINRLWHIDV